MGARISTEPEHRDCFVWMASQPFELCYALKKCGLGGALCHVEPHVSFFPGRRDWSEVDHFVIPHGNLLFNSPEPIDRETARDIFRLYGSLFASEVSLGYPDIWFDGIKSQEKIATWLNYALKPWKTEVWYQGGCRRDIKRDHLNYLFDKIVYENLVALFSTIRTVRKYGNQDCKTKAYIADRLPRRIKLKTCYKWLKDEKFAARHPELESSVWRIIRKREMRQGRKRQLPPESEPG